MMGASWNMAGENKLFCAIDDFLDEGENSACRWEVCDTPSYPQWLGRMGYITPNPTIIIYSL